MNFTFGGFLWFWSWSWGIHGRGHRYGGGQAWGGSVTIFSEEIIRSGVGERVRVNAGVSTGVRYDVWDGG